MLGAPMTALSPRLRTVHVGESCTIFRVLAVTLRGEVRGRWLRHEVLTPLLRCHRPADPARVPTAGPGRASPWQGLRRVSVAHGPGGGVTIARIPMRRQMRWGWPGTRPGADIHGTTGLSIDTDASARHLLRLPAPTP